MLLIHCNIYYFLFQVTNYGRRSWRAVLYFNEKFSKALDKYIKRWYNLESYFANNGAYSGRVSIEENLTSSELSTLNEFINDNYKLNNKLLKIVHGKGEGILKDELHKFLKTKKEVKEYKLDIFNISP